MTEQTNSVMERAKQFAPWRSDLPWWIVLIEGLVLGGVGVLVLLDPSQTSANVSLFLTFVLLVAGLLQSWAVFRSKFSPSYQRIAAAQGAVGMYTGVVIWLLFFMDALMPVVGVVIFGTGSLIYGLLGIMVGFGSAGAKRRSELIESIFFAIIGVLMLYVLFAGPTGVVTATRIVGWLALLCGVSLIGLSIWRWRQEAKAKETAEELMNLAQETSESVESGSPDAKSVTRETAASLNE